MQEFYFHNYLIYKSSSLVNKKQILDNKDFIIEDNKVANPIYAPAIVCASDNSLLSIQDKSLYLKIYLSESYSLLDLEVDKLQDILIGVGSLEFNQIYCMCLNNKNYDLDPCSKKRDWNWFSKNEDFLEEVSDEIDSTFSFLLPAMYKQFSKKKSNLIKVGLNFLILQPTVVISKIDNF